MATTRTGYAIFAALISCYGIFLMTAPDDSFSPAWSYFASHGEIIIPAGGFGMGLCLTGLGVLQLLALKFEAWVTVSVLFFLSGFVFWTSGLLLAAEGIQSQEGWQAAPLMLLLGGHKFVLSVNARVRRGQ